MPLVEPVLGRPLWPGRRSVRPPLGDRRPGQQAQQGSAGDGDRRLAVTRRWREPSRLKKPPDPLGPSRSISARMLARRSPRAASARSVRPCASCTQPGSSTAATMPCRFTSIASACHAMFSAALDEPVRHVAAGAFGDAAHAAGERDQLAARFGDTRQQRLGQQIGRDAVGGHHVRPAAAVFRTVSPAPGCHVPALAIEQIERAVDAARRTRRRLRGRLVPAVRRELRASPARRSTAGRWRPPSSRPAYWRANSRPMPRLAPVIRTVGMTRERGGREKAQSCAA